MKININNKGQALITLLFYVIIILIITTAAVMLVATNALSATKLQEGTLAFAVAEGGAENAILRLLRDPSYAGENDMEIGDGTADIVVTPGNPVTIISTGSLGNFKRSVRVTLNQSAGYYTITSWQEVP